jgi:hypothetical protein
LNLDKLLFRNVDPEGADFGTGHGGLPSVDRASMYANPTCEVNNSL